MCLEEGQPALCRTGTPISHFSLNSLPLGLSTALSWILKLGLPLCLSYLREKILFLKMCTSNSLPSE